MKIAGSVVVVTGAAGGIGESMARGFVAAGAKALTVVDIDGDRLAAVANDIGALAVVANLRDEREVERVVVETEAANGPIDIFCSNAGIIKLGGPEVPTDEWQEIWDINVMAHVHAARAVLPGMLERGRGHLVNTASAAGVLSQIGSAPYTVTKAGAVSLAEWLAITYGERGISVSVVCPQAVATPMTRDVGDGGVAGVDGMMGADAVAEVVIAGVEADEFFILPHPEVAEYAARKGADRPRWIAGMQRLQRRFPGGRSL